MSSLTISAEVLQILMTGSFDKDKLISKLVMMHPQLFIELMHDDVTYQLQQEFSPEDSLMTNKVRAIKKYRSITGSSLIDSKKAVEDLIKTNQLRTH